MKRIIHVITTLERGGAEIAVGNLAIGQVSKDYWVYVMPLKGEKQLMPELLSSGVKIGEELWGKLPLVQLLKLIKLLRGSDPSTIVHAHLPRAELLLAVAKRLSFYRRSTFATRHNSEAFYPVLPGKISSWLSRVVTAGCHVIAISYAVKEFLVTNCELAPDAEISVIEYGYLRRFRSIYEKKESRTFHARLGVVARLEVQKGIDVLLKACAELKGRGYQFALKIIGEGSQYDNLKQLAQALELQDMVSFLGRKLDVYAELQDMDLFVLPSRYEGLGMVLLEAMDVGVPIIATDIPSTIEVLGGSHPGLVPSENYKEMSIRIAKFIDNSEIARKSVLLQTERLKLFSMQKYISMHELLYQKVFGEPQ